jgi:hypothetical protein
VGQFALSEYLYRRATRHVSGSGFHDIRTTHGSG